MIPTGKVTSATICPPMVFDQPSIPGMTGDKLVLASLDGAATYLGGQAGLALGYKHVFIGFELTMVKFWTSASLKVSQTSTTSTSKV